MDFRFNLIFKLIIYRKAGPGRAGPGLCEKNSGRVGFGLTKFGRAGPGWVLKTLSKFGSGRVGFRKYLGPHISTLN